MSECLPVFGFSAATGAGRDQVLSSSSHRLAAQWSTETSALSFQSVGSYAALDASRSRSAVWITSNLTRALPQDCRVTHRTSLTPDTDAEQLWTTLMALNADRGLVKLGFERLLEVGGRQEGLGEDRKSVV